MHTAFRIMEFNPNAKVYVLRKDWQPKRRAQIVPTPAPVKSKTLEEIMADVEEQPRDRCAVIETLDPEIKRKLMRLPASMREDYTERVAIMMVEGKIYRAFAEDLAYYRVRPRM